jgi:hypothetical protein
MAIPWFDVACSILAPAVRRPVASPHSTDDPGAYTRDTCHACGRPSDDCDQIGDRLYCPRPDCVQAGDAYRCEVAAVDMCGLEFSDEERANIVDFEVHHEVDVRQVFLDYSDALNAATLAAVALEQRAVRS